MRSPLVFLTAVALVPATARAGAWTRDAGGGYARVGLSALLPGDGYLDGDGKRQSMLNATYRDLAITANGEIGVLDRLTALVGLTVWSVDLDAAVYDGRGGTSFTVPGHGIVGARYRFLDEPLLLAIQGEAKIALLRDQDPGPHRWGDGRDEGRIVAVASRSLGSFWLSGELGVNLRAEDPVHQIVYLAQGGSWLGPVGFAVDLDGAESIEGSPDDPTLGGEYADVTNPLVDTVVADAHHRLGVKILGRLAPWLEVDAGFQLTYRGRSFANAPRVNVGAALLF